MTGIKIAIFLAMVMGMLPIRVDDAAATCAEVKVLGYKVIRETGFMKYGCSIIAFLEGPDGYKVELIQKGTQFG